MNESVGSTIVETALSEPFRDLPYDEGRVADVRSRLDATGVVVLDDFLSLEGHALLKEQILEREKAATGERKKFAIKGRDLDPTVVGQLARSDYMLDFANKLLGAANGRPAYVDEPIRQDEIIPGINIMRTTSDVTAFHFDGTYLNMILPVVLPSISGPQRGQFVIYPNLRPFSKSLWGAYAAPLVAYRTALLRKLLASRRREIDYRERGAYLFFGYRSLHGVEAQSENALRAITNMTVGSPRFREEHADSLAPMRRNPSRGRGFHDGRSWIRTRDLRLIRAAL